MIFAVMMVLLVLAGLLQDLGPSVVWLGQTKAPLLFAVAMYYAVAHGRTAMLVSAVAAGLVQDSGSLVPIGYSSLCFCVLGLGIHSFRGPILPRAVLTAALIGGGGNAFATGLLQILLIVGLDYGPGPWWWILLRLTGAAFLGAIVVPLVWRLADAADRLVGNVEPLEMEP